MILNKPIIIRVSILDFSKFYIYEFWYEYVKEKYEDDVEFNYININFYIFKSKIMDIYKNIAK